MKTIYRRPVRPTIPGYSENGALQLIVATGVTFILFHFTRVVMLIVGKEKDEVFQIMFSNIGLPAPGTFLPKFWTLVTYGWVHHGFLEWFTNMIWLYVFASVLQAVASYKQIIPLFFMALIGGGIVDLGVQMIPVQVFHPRQDFLLGSQAGIVALGVAALTLSPSYRLYLTPGFSIPLWLVVAIHGLLQTLVYVPYNIPGLALCAGGAMTGLLYAVALKNGYNAGEAIYRRIDNLQQRFSPPEDTIAPQKSRKRVEILRTMYEAKGGITQETIDEILDKINEKGYHSLTREERQVLFRAGKE